MQPELLLPAGDMEKLKIAFQYGADAVYAGVPMFSLRARENKFSIDSVREAVKYARKLGKKIYLTLNIFPRNFKIAALEKALKQLAKLKPDAFIVADPGVIMLCKKLAPKVPLHLSVQANNVNWASARFWHKQGIERIILSREISLPEIREIHKKNPKLELEFFVHGSICMAYSGRCLMSNYLAYRDANQGTCAHICRFKYKTYLEEESSPGRLLELEEDGHGAYVMNSKDICLVEFLKDLKKAGVCSFKVEGRNKTAYYAANAARTYRRAIDEMESGQPFNPGHIHELEKASNRGFMPAFLTGNPHEKAQEYEKNRTHQTYEYIGIVRAVRGGRYEIEVKGRLDAPCTCEIMTPEEDFRCRIKNFTAPDGKTITTIHPGQKDRVLIEVPHKLPVGAILRNKRRGKPSI